MTKIRYYFKQTLFYLFLMLYFFLLAKSLLFKQVSLFEIFSADRVIIRTINLIPFKTIFQYLANPHINMWIALMNVVGNIVLFIPLGMYLQIFRKNKRILSCVALISAISLCVEITQYIFGIGSTDIDDIILNIFGGLLGVFIYKIMHSLLKDEDKTKTAVTFLFCLAGACFGICYLTLVYLLRLRIKIF